MCVPCVWLRPKHAAAPANSRDFIRRAQRETGLKLDIITAEEEARLAVVSCASLVAADTEQLSGHRHWRRVHRIGLDRPVARCARGAAQRDLVHV